MGFKIKLWAHDRWISHEIINEICLFCVRITAYLHAVVCVHAPAYKHNFTTVTDNNGTVCANCRDGRENERELQTVYKLCSERQKINCMCTSLNKNKI